jgi:internalin A
MHRASRDSPQVTDKGLKDLGPLKDMEDLVLGDTAITDSGLKDLAELKGLTASVSLGPELLTTDLRISLHSRCCALCRFEDRRYGQGVRQLTGLNQLRYLQLLQTKVTGAGVKELKGSLPDCHIVVR